jgi:hypothetical protein
MKAGALRKNPQSEVTLPPSIEIRYGSVETESVDSFLRYTDEPNQPLIFGPRRGNHILQSHGLPGTFVPASLCPKAVFEKLLPLCYKVLKARGVYERRYSSRI